MDSWGKKGKEEKKEDCHVISHSMSLSLSLSAPPEGKGGVFAIDCVFTIDDSLLCEY